MSVRVLASEKRFPKHDPRSSEEPGHRFGAGSETGLVADVEVAGDGERQNSKRA